MKIIKNSIALLLFLNLVSCNKVSTLSSPTLEESINGLSSGSLSAMYEMHQRGILITDKNSGFDEIQAKLPDDEIYMSNKTAIQKQHHETSIFGYKTHFFREISAMVELKYYMEKGKVKYYRDRGQIKYAFESERFKRYYYRYSTGEQWRVDRAIFYLERLRDYIEAATTKYIDKNTINNISKKVNNFEYRVLTESEYKNIIDQIFNKYSKIAMTK